MNLTQDSIPINLNRRKHQETSPVYSLELKSDNLWTLPQGKPVVGTLSPMVAGGYWLIVEPLPPGKHLLEYGWKLPIFRVYRDATVTVHVVTQNEPLLFDPIYSANAPPRLRIAGEIGRTCIVQASSDLVNWVPVSTNKVATKLFEVTDTTPPQSAPRFYRALYSP